MAAPSGRARAAGACVAAGPALGGAAPRRRRAGPAGRDSQDGSRGPLAPAGSRVRIDARRATGRSSVREGGRPLRPGPLRRARDLRPDPGRPARRRVRPGHVAPGRRSPTDRGRARRSRVLPGGRSPGARRVSTCLRRGRPRRNGPDGTRSRASGFRRDPAGPATALTEEDRPCSTYRRERDGDRRNLGTNPKADVVVAGGRSARWAPPGRRAPRVIDAAGLIVAPIRGLDRSCPSSSWRSE